jgi:SMC interacting uncharacterized protein involved in chromosome segregation
MIREIKLLTRQRNEAQERMNRQELDCIKLSKVNQELQSDVNELKELVEYLQDRIKLMKSTGDELLEWLKDGTISDSNYRLLANAWQRAKENKR